jgi:hypothetical protein
MLERRMWPGLAVLMSLSLSACGATHTWIRGAQEIPSTVSHVLLLPPLLLSDIEGTDRLTPAEQEAARLDSLRASAEAKPAAGTAATAGEAPDPAAPANETSSADETLGADAEPEGGIDADVEAAAKEDGVDLTVGVPTNGLDNTSAKEGKAKESSWIFTDDVPDVFLEGNAVGFLYHRGGFITEQSHVAYVRTKNVKLKEHEGYAKRIGELAGDLLIRHLELRNIAVDEGLEISHEALPTLKRRNRRVTLEELEDDDLMGSDNANLPPFDVIPARKWKTIPTEGPLAEADFVLVPIVIHYYVHNVGWFRGQEWGSGGAGGRARLLWALYATDDGRLVAWSDVEARENESARLHPNMLEVDDILIKLDVKFEQVLGQSLAL